MQTDEITSIATTSNRNILQRGECECVRPLHVSENTLLQPFCACMHACIHSVHRYAGNLAELKRRWQTRVILFDEWSFAVFKALSRLIVFNNVEFPFSPPFFFLISFFQNAKFFETYFFGGTRWYCNFFLIVLSFAELLLWIYFYTNAIFFFKLVKQIVEKVYKWWFIAFMRRYYTINYSRGLSHVSTLEHQMQPL